jgi:hypothetical protein
MPILAEFRPTGKSIKSESGASHVAPSVPRRIDSPSLARIGNLEATDQLPPREATECAAGCSHLHDDAHTSLRLIVHVELPIFRTQGEIDSTKG